MILFYSDQKHKVYAVGIQENLAENSKKKLSWLFSGAQYIEVNSMQGSFIGPRKEMVTPWSTNAVEITQNMGISGIKRIEEFTSSDQSEPSYDPMLQRVYHTLDQELFTINKKPDPVRFIENIEQYNREEGLALNNHEINYLSELGKKLGRLLTDSEIFGFSQVNSEHCRHKIFNGEFVIDGKAKKHSLFQLIKNTTKANSNRVVSAYKDNCAFLQGPVIEQFAPASQDRPDYFVIKEIESVLSLKAETHNFPTTVEPFNGAATGTGGEIRDRMGGGKAAIPLAGTAVYMTPYSRLQEGRAWEKAVKPRNWLYQSPSQILIKASNGASDFGNKFGQPLICGSLFTFEHTKNNKTYSYDKVIMLAGGIGFGKKTDSEKGHPHKGDLVVLLGGDNYRIGMGGGAVSSVATGEYDNTIELNAVQRSNPEMQKRVFNAIRALSESDINPIISIHDHGAGGHLNCLSELLEETGGIIFIEKLPVGDPTLSDREIIGNESQERMGLIVKTGDIKKIQDIAERERAPVYIIGEATGDHQFSFIDKDRIKPMNISLDDMFGSPPKTILNDQTSKDDLQVIEYDEEKIEFYLEQVLQIESVACKDWLTNKVDRSVTGKVARQQTTGSVQLPLNDVAVSALDYAGYKGIATSIGHAPASALIDAKAGSILAIAEALTNIVWAPIADGLRYVSLSANWMWPCKNPGEDARLYNAVEAAGDFAIQLKINIPTGKDSLSMTQKYTDGEVVYAPGTVIISAAGEVSDFRMTIGPALKSVTNSSLVYIPFSEATFCLGGSSFAQIVGCLGNHVPTIPDAVKFGQTWEMVQQFIKEDYILAGHDVSAGGLITTLLEMCFPDNATGLDCDITLLSEHDMIRKFFSESPAVVIQTQEPDILISSLKSIGVTAVNIGQPINQRELRITNHKKTIKLDIQRLRDTWFHTSYLFDKLQTSGNHAHERFINYKKQELQFRFPKSFTGLPEKLGISLKRRGLSGIKSAIIREKGVNGDREMAYSLYLAGFDVKDVHMTDLISGRETLEDTHMIVFVGGFSNSDVLGSAKGWAGAFLFNSKAKESLDRFYARPDTLSLGVCNGCQLVMELGLITENHEKKSYMSFNESHKFESAFLNVDIVENRSIMLHSLKGSRLGIWVAHGEGKFNLPLSEDRYNVALKYSYDEYPGNPNGSDYSVAGLYSDDGRHLAMMPHIERAIFPWNWAYYPDNRKDDLISPWIEAFVNARKWIEEKR